MSLTSKRQLPNLNNERIRQINSTLIVTENDLRHAQQSLKSFRQARAVPENGVTRLASVRMEKETDGRMMDKVVQSRLDRRLLEIERQMRRNHEEPQRIFLPYPRVETVEPIRQIEESPSKKILVTQQNSTNLRESAKSIRESVVQLKDELMRHEDVHDQHTSRDEDLLSFLNRRRHTGQNHVSNENGHSPPHTSPSSKSPNFNYKKELEKHERQRDQLTVELEALTRTCEQKDKLLSKTSAELREATESSDTFERQNLKLQHDLTFALQRLEEMTEQAERFAQESLNSQKLLADSEQKHEEFQIQVQESNKQWKARVQKLEKDIERHKLDSAHLAEKNEQLLKEIDGHKLQGMNLREQIMKLETDANEANVTCSRWEEQCKRKDNEIIQLQHIRSSHEGEAASLKETVNELSGQVSTQRQRLLQLDSEKQGLHQRLQEELIEKNHRDLKIKHYEEELEAGSTSRSQLQRQILELENDRKKSAQRLKDIQFERDRLAEAKARLLAFERDYHELKIDHRRSLTAMQIDHERERERCQSQLSEEKMRVNTLQRQEHEQKKELERLHDRAVRFEDEAAQKQHTIESLSADIHGKTRAIAELESKVHKLTVEATNQKNLNIKKDDDYQHSLQMVYNDLVHCTGCLSTESSRPFSIESAIASRDGLDVWTSKLKAHFTWLKQELELRQDQEKKLRQDLNNTLLDCEADRVHFASELAKREAMIDKFTHDQHEQSQRQSFDMHHRHSTEDERDQIDGRYRQFQTLIDSVKRELQTAKVQLSA